VVKKVAAELRNTPAVCRKSYINPVVFAAWRSGSLHKAIRDDIIAAPRKAERLALSFLRRQSRADKRGPRTNPATGRARVP
jgi:DNA topoisomerase IB